MSKKIGPEKIQAIVKIVSIIMLIIIFKVLAGSGSKEVPMVKKQEDEISTIVSKNDIETISGLDTVNALISQSDIPIENSQEDVAVLTTSQEVETVSRSRVLPVVSRSGQDMINRRVEALKKLENELKEVPIVESAGLAASSQKTTKELVKNGTPMVVEATAYCPGIPSSGCPLKNGYPSCTGKYANGYTATGVKAKAGDGTLENPHIIATDPRIIPMKTLVYIEGYGYARAEDVGGAIKGKRIDLLFDTHAEALQFGRQRLKIYILD